MPNEGVLTAVTCHACGAQTDIVVPEGVTQTHWECSKDDTKNTWNQESGSRPFLPYAEVDELMERFQEEVRYITTSDGASSGEGSHTGGVE